MSESAKEHSREILEAAGITVDHSGKPERGTEDEHETRVLAGYKAALHSASFPIYGSFECEPFSPSDPRVSDAAKQHAREYLRKRGVTV
jgi:hypothetical protein